MKLLLILATVVVVCQCTPDRHRRVKHVLDRVGPIAKAPMAVTKIEKNERTDDKFELETPPDIMEINKDLGLEQGDIMKNLKNSRSTILESEYSEYFWHNKTVPVQYMGDITLLKKATIDEARKQYELRTCIHLPERTDEDNYITFRSLGGCWSYIGMNGGPQNISIGDGCERIGTIEHEIMHALGIFHEQSRADRDEYVEIIWDKIRPGIENNYDNYGYNVTDNKRVPYDYYSVMHYSKTSGSVDGNVTIRTRDPAFADVIGQRGSFSEGDVEKISRMYKCSDTIRITNSENFEDEAEGGYSSYGMNSDADWLQHKLGVSDDQGPTSTFLPTFDSTLGIEGEGSFMYLDTTAKYPGLSGVLKSMRYTTTVAEQCLEFSYYISIDPNSRAALTVYIAELDDVTGEITSYGLPLQTFTSGGAEWNVHRMTISAPKDFRVVFYAKTDYFASDVIAIDDVTVLDSECDTSYFLVPDYSGAAETYAVGEAIESPLMYTGNPGYAFKVLVYPNGTQSAVDDGYTNYMGVYFQLCSGLHDDVLDWPFDKQYVRLTAVDQGPNPQTRMNTYLNFLTDYSSSLNASYEEPTEGTCNQEVGYRTFMKKEKFNTRMYLKHGLAYFSAQVTDMRPYQNDIKPSASLRNPVIRRANQRSLHQDKFEWGHGEEEKEKVTMIPLEEAKTKEPDVPEDEQSNDGMVTVGTAAIITLAMSLGVFFIMSLVICCVASSYRKKVNEGTMVTNNINHVYLDTLKYSNLKGKF